MAKLMFKAIGITTMLVTIAVLLLIPSVFAYSGTNVNNNQDTDGSTWQVSERVTGYYNTLGHYEEVYHQSWRGCISPVSYGTGMYYRWSASGSLGGYDTGIVLVSGAISAASTIKPSDYGVSYVEHASSYSASYFVINGVTQFKQSTVSI
jgi:hypothetical protein